MIFWSLLNSKERITHYIYLFLAAAMVLNEASFSTCLKLLITCFTSFCNYNCVIFKSLYNMKKQKSTCDLFSCLIQNEWLNLKFKFEVNVRLENYMHHFKICCQRVKLIYQNLESMKVQCKLLFQKEFLN